MKNETSFISNLLSLKFKNKQFNHVENMNIKV